MAQIAGQPVAQINHRVNGKMFRQPARLFEPRLEFQMLSGERAAEFACHKNRVAGFRAAPQDLFSARDRSEQRAERYAVGDRLDAQITNIDKAARRVSLSVKALEMAEDKEAIEKFGSSDSGASLGDILGAAMREKANKE